MTMANITNTYKQEGSDGHFQYSEQKDGLDLSMFALDLSRKKDVTEIILPKIIKERVNGTMDLSQIFPVSEINKRYQQINLPEEDGQIPIAGSSAMLSPYSESNSPKKLNAESAGYYENNNRLKHNASLNIRNITPGIMMMTPQQPSLPVLPNEATKMPVALPMMPVPCTETSQSFAHNEAERNISLTMPAEYSDMRLASSLKKTPRPFKAYPKNFLSVAPTLDYNSNEDFKKFRERMLEEVKKTNGNTPNPKMRRVSKDLGLPTSTVDEKDAAYYERRRKNNEAAKRSREARRAKEDELAIRAAYLEHENAQLKHHLKKLQLMYSHLYKMIS